MDSGEPLTSETAVTTSAVLLSLAGTDRDMLLRDRRRLLYAAAKIHTQLAGLGEAASEQGLRVVLGLADVGEHQQAAALARRLASAARPNTRHRPETDSRPQTRRLMDLRGVALDWLTDRLDNLQTAADADSLDVLRLLSTFAADAHAELVDEAAVLIVAQATAGVARRNESGASAIAREGLVLLERLPPDAPGVAASLAVARSGWAGSQGEHGASRDQSVTFGQLVEADRVVSMLAQLASECEDRGDQESRSRSLERALALHRRWFPISDGRSCELVYGLVDAWAALGEHDRADRLARETASALPSKNGWRILLELRLALTRTEAGLPIPPDDSIEHHLGRFRRAFTNHPEAVRNQLADSVLAMPDPLQAEPLAREIVQLLDRLPAPETAQEADVRAGQRIVALTQLSAAAKRRGQWEAGCDHLEEAYRLTDDHPVLGAEARPHLLTILAQTYARALWVAPLIVRATMAGREVLFQAMQALAEASRLAERHPPSERADLAMEVATAAFGLARVGLDPQWVEADLCRALAQAAETPGIDPEWAAQAHALLGILVTQSGQARTGRRYLRTAAQLLGETDRMRRHARLFRYTTDWGRSRPWPNHRLRVRERLWGMTVPDRVIMDGLAGTDPRGRPTIWPTVARTRHSVWLPRGFLRPIGTPPAVFQPQPLDIVMRAVGIGSIYAAFALGSRLVPPGPVDLAAGGFTAVLVLLPILVLLLPVVIYNRWLTQGACVALTTEGIYARRYRIDWREVAGVRAGWSGTCFRVQVATKSGATHWLPWPRRYRWWPRSRRLAADVATIKEWVTAHGGNAATEVRRSYLRVTAGAVCCALAIGIVVAASVNREFIWPWTPAVESVPGACDTLRNASSTNPPLTLVAQPLGDARRSTGSFQSASCLWQAATPQSSDPELMLLLDITRLSDTFANSGIRRAVLYSERVLTKDSVPHRLSASLGYAVLWRLPVAWGQEFDPAQPHSVVGVRRANLVVTVFLVGESSHATADLESAALTIASAVAGRL